VVEASRQHDATLSPNPRMAPTEAKDTIGFAMVHPYFRWVVSSKGHDSFYKIGLLCGFVAKEE